MRKKILQTMRFQTKLSLTVSLLITVLMMISAAVLNRIMLQNTWQNWDRANQQVFQSMLLSMENQLKHMDEVSKNVHASALIQRTFQNIPAHEGNYFDRDPLLSSSLSGEIYSAVGSLPLNGQITVVSRTGDYVYVDNQTGDLVLGPANVLALDEVRWGLTTREFVHISVSEHDPWHTNRDAILTLTRPLRTSYETLGVILYSVPLETLNKLYSAYLLDDDISLALLNEEQQVLYKYAPGDTQPMPDNWYTETTSARLDSYESSRTRIIIEPVGNTGLRLAQMISLDSLRSQVMRLQIVLIGSYLAALICVLVMTNLVMRRLSAPLRQLRSQVDRISLDGELLVTAQNENNEIHALGDAIGEMVQRFRIQNERLLLARERDMHSSLNAMEAQLNSHFLYNTLAVIGAVGQMEGSQTTPRLCAQLASLLRYSVQFNFQCVTLRDELDNVRNYLNIMAMRYAGQTDFLWELDPATYAIQVPKLILQPIVENCFKHGFEGREGPRRIRIISRCDDMRWSVEVRNNGVPMSQDAIDSINQRLERYREELGRERLDGRSFGTGFGLGNTALRLYLFYKSDETFRIGTEGEETIVEIGGPIHAK